MQTQSSQPVNLIRRLSCVAALLVIAACGGGGGGGNSPGAATAPPEPDRVGQGWIETSGQWMTTEGQELYVSGTAFVSPKHWACCTGEPSDTGVVVSWENTTTGARGNAHQTPQYIFLFVYILANYHSWDAQIPLAVGSNSIVVTATDPDGNLGRVRFRVQRTPDRTPPLVTSTSPASGASGIDATSAVAITFSEAMDPLSISAATFTLAEPSGQLVAGTVAYANGSATFAPLAPLRPLTTYTATVTIGANDVAHNPLAAAHAWQFTTAAPAAVVVPPTVSATSPASGATCVPTETYLRAQFSKVVAPGSVSVATFLVHDSLGNRIAGSAMLSGVVTGPGYVDHIAVFSPVNSFANAATYRATLTTGIKDLSGNALPADYAWTFTTASEGAGIWSPMSRVGAPSPRYRHSAVWSGTELFVWGGDSRLGGVLRDGARYRVSDDSWRPMSSSGAPEAATGQVAVWAGDRMLIWGGVGPVGSGASYDPVADSWTPLAAQGAPSPRSNAAGAWTGRELIVWGGLGSGGLRADGARYDPATDSWTPIATAGAPSARRHAAVTWTGTQIFVFGGATDAGFLDSGALYDPVTDTWTPLPSAGAPAPRADATAVWTGREVIVWGGHNAEPLATGARFDPVTSTWRTLPDHCAPVGRYGHTAVWTGSEMLVSGGGVSNGPHYVVGGRYDPLTDEWQPLATAGGPGARQYAQGEWTGAELVIWGGLTAPATTLDTGGRFRPW